MRLSAAAISLLAGSSLAAPASNTTVKPHDVVIDLPPPYLDAATKFAALQKASNGTYGYVYSFTAVAEQHCQGSRATAQVYLSSLILS